MAAERASERAPPYLASRPTPGPPPDPTSGPENQSRTRPPTSVARPVASARPAQAQSAPASALGAGVEALGLRQVRGRPPLCSPAPGGGRLGGRLHWGRHVVADWELPRPRPRPARYSDWGGGSEGSLGVSSDQSYAKSRDPSLRTPSPELSCFFIQRGYPCLRCGRYSQALWERQSRDPKLTCEIWEGLLEEVSPHARSWGGWGLVLEGLEFQAKDLGL